MDRSTLSAFFQFGQQKKRRVSDDQSNLGNLNHLREGFFPTNADAPRARQSWRLMVPYVNDPHS